MGGANTATGLAALDNVLLRLGSLFYASFDGTYSSMPNFSQTTIETSLIMGGIADGELDCNKLPPIVYEDLYLESCGIAAITGNLSKLWGDSESGLVSLDNNLLSEGDVDAILAAAVALDGSSMRPHTLALGGANEPPSAAGVADAATLSGYGWTVYVSS
jgi:hypothetical protein